MKSIQKIIFNSNIPTSILQYSKNLENLIIVNRLSKSISITGWRISWENFPNCLINDAEKYAVNIFSCVNNFTQFAAICALVKGFDYSENLKSIFNSRVTFMINRINQINGISVSFQAVPFIVL